jgi:hypothetical protein
LRRTRHQRPSAALPASGARASAHPDSGIGGPALRNCRDLRFPGSERLVS